MTSQRFDIIYIPLGTAGMGGAERSLAYLCAAMAKKGKRVCVLCERALQETVYPKLVSELGIEIHWVDWAPERSYLTNLMQATRVFRAFPATIIHFNISWRRGMWLIPIAARLVSRARLMGSMRAMPDPHSNIPRRKHFGFVPGLRLWHIPEIIVGWIWGRVLDSTVSVNARDYPDRLISGYGYPRERISTIYNGVELRSIPLEPHRRTEIRREFGVDDHKVLVNFFGRLDGQKGIDHLIRSLARLPDSYHLLLLGIGPAEGELRALVGELGLNGRVHFAGFLFDIDDVVAASDIVAVPSVWYEACPRQIIEAMNQGVPVVASRIGGIPEMFSDGVEGILVPPADVDALADALRRVGDDASLRARMGEAGRRHARLKYDMKVVIDSYDAIYQRLSIA